MRKIIDTKQLEDNIKELKAMKTKDSKKIIAIFLSALAIMNGCEEFTKKLFEIGILKDKRTNLDIREQSIFKMFNYLNFICVNYFKLPSYIKEIYI